MAKKLLVLGAQGMLGSIVFKYLLSKCVGEIRGTARTKDVDPFIHIATFDSIDDKSILEVIKKHKPDFVINCIGAIPQKYNSDNNQFHLLNTILPIHLANSQFIYNYKLIHISTDCVFKHQKIATDGYNLYRTFDEEYFVTEEDQYGYTKLEADKTIDLNAIILRGSVIGPTYKNKGEGLTNFVVKNRNKEVNGYTNHYWNGNTTLQIAKIIEQIVKSETHIDNGIYHLGNYHIVNKYELVKMISDAFDLNVTVNPYKTEEVFDRTISYSDKFVLPTITEQLKEFRLWVEEEKMPIW